MLHNRSHFFLPLPLGHTTIQRPNMLSTHAQIGGVLKKAFRGELIDTQFCVYTARSKREGKATKPQGLFVNDEALAASSGYFRGCRSFTVTCLSYSIEFNGQLQYFFPSINLSMILP